MSNSDLSSTIAQGLQQEAITLAERLAARTDEPSLMRAAELLAIMAAVPTVDLRPHLEWALKRISTSLGEGEHYAAALHALEEAQQPAAVAPIAGHADIFQVGYWLSHEQLRLAGSFDIHPLCGELKSGGWSEASVFVGMPTLHVTLARGNEGDLAALVKRLARELRKAKPGNEMSDQAMDYLKRQGLLGSPLRDALALEAPAAGVQAVRDGWKLVPMEPTAEMVAAACRDHGYPGGTRSVYVLGYRSMLAAAPQASAAPAPAEPAAAILFENEDGRHAVWQGAGSPSWTYGDPKWHRVGPVDISGISIPAIAAAAEVEIEWDVLPENAGERAMFDRNLDLLYGGDPRVFITTSLRLWANTAANGSFGAMCAVFANEVAKMHIAAPQVVQALEKARHGVAAIDAVGLYNDQEVILRSSALDVLDGRSAAFKA